MADDGKQMRERDLVLYQLLSSDPNLKLSVGGDEAKSYSRDQIIEHVRELDEVGQDYVDTQMNFMRAVSSGEMFNMLNERLNPQG
jgi:hypothetical protein